MIYINKVILPSPRSEVYSYQQYPMSVFQGARFDEMSMNDITLLYGGNGSGKSTLLNIIGELISVSRKKPFFKDQVFSSSAWGAERLAPFEMFLEECELELIEGPRGRDITLPPVRKLITSDDIFKEVETRVAHNIEARYDGEDALQKRGDLLQEWRDGYRFRGLSDYDHFHEIQEARKQTISSFVNARTRAKKKIESNGETALSYFANMLEADGIYLLDEPENCLSPVFQLELMKIIEGAARFDRCQFIIATHSPLILSLGASRIYELDSRPISTKKWEDLESVRLYYEFFKSMESRFKNE